MRGDARIQKVGDVTITICRWISVAGKTEDALDCLERAAETGLSQREWYENDSDLDPLREHPRFKALMQNLI